MEPLPSCGLLFSIKNKIILKISIVESYEFWSQWNEEMFVGSKEFLEWGDLQYYAELPQAFGGFVKENNEI